MREEDRARDGLFETIVAADIERDLGAEVLRHCSRELAAWVVYDAAQKTIAIVVDPYYAPAPVYYALQEAITVETAHQRWQELQRRYTAAELARKMVGGLSLGRMLATEYGRLLSDKQLGCRLAYHHFQVWRLVGGARPNTSRSAWSP